MPRHTRHRRILAIVATAAGLAASAPAAPAMPIRDGGGSAGAVAVTEPERVRVVRVQVNEGLNWGDAGIGAAGMLALALIGYGGAHALTRVPRRKPWTARS